MQKQQSKGKVFLHVSTNDAISKTSDVILKDLLLLKIYIESTLPSCVINISEPTIWYDNVKARLTITHLIENLRNLDIKLLTNDNIMQEHVSKKGLHLNVEVRQGWP